CRFIEDDNTLIR
ncbi:unnamed protein product, partial [Leptidea sinapis]